MSGFDNTAPPRFTPQMPYVLGIIGGGNMGAAIVRGCVDSPILQGDQIIVAEIDRAKQDEFRKLGCAVTDNAAEASEAEQILLAVKPQVFPQIARQIGPMRANKIMISIMAGRTSESIQKALGGGGSRIIRAMPNTPCQIGAGMTAIAIGAGAAKGDEAFAVKIFSAIGRTVMVDESLMYAVTAVSASGPGYIFLIAEAMEQAARELGVDAPTARLLVAQMIFGSGKLLVESSSTAAQLRQAVTSPGGTTAAALEVMFEKELPQIISEALLAARNRGIELGQT